MDGSVLSLAINASLSAGWHGTQLTPFCNALGMGIVTALKGQLTFTTVDVGLVAGAGPAAGIGAGIKGMVPANIQTTMYNAGQASWSAFQRDGPGVQWMTFCMKVSTAVNLHLKTTSILTSTHAPVYLGSGTVQSYSGVTASQVQAAILAAAPPSWAAHRFSELALAVATGLMTEILGHSPTDTVTITGSPSGTPASGAGVGSGIVT